MSIAFPKNNLKRGVTELIQQIWLLRLDKSGEHNIWPVGHMWPPAEIHDAARLTCCRIRKITTYSTDIFWHFTTIKQNRIWLVISKSYHQQCSWKSLTSSVQLHCVLYFVKKEFWSSTGVSTDTNIQQLSQMHWNFFRFLAAVTFVSKRSHSWL